MLRLTVLFPLKQGSIFRPESKVEKMKTPLLPLVDISLMDKNSNSPDDKLIKIVSVC